MRIMLRSVVFCSVICLLAVAPLAAQQAQQAEEAQEAAASDAGPEGSAAPSTAPGEEPAPPCSSPEHRQFDFWIGSWEVTEPDGEPAGTNRVEVLYGGCVLQENWEGVSGSVGTSFNLYDEARGVWHQTWVDGRGGMLLLEGGMEGDAMVMRGERPSRQEPGVQVLHEIRWEPLDEGKVRQLWRASRDGGETWTVLFDGTYAPMS